MVHDGLGRPRRIRRFSRAERSVRRIVVLGHTGSITLDAIAWCQHVAITREGLALLGRGACVREL